MTSSLNTSQAKNFWKEFNKLFKPPSDQMVEALISEDGTILTENADIEKEMFVTFFRLNTSNIILISLMMLSIKK